MSINNSGQIVGGAYNSSGNARACLFDPTGGGANIDLNTLIDPSSGWILQYANSINNNGWIVGFGTNPAGYTRAYLLIPEPATIILLGTAGIWIFTRKKQFLEGSRGK
jgi:probable HAF family extracellular repeat protein